MTVDDVIYIGPSCYSPFLGKWCGQSNQTLVSTGQDMFLVYVDGRRYTSLPWTVQYRMTESDAAPAVAPQTASSSSQAGVVVGSVFGVVLLILAVVGALITWRMYRRKDMSSYQNQDIINQSEAGSSVSMVTPAAFSNGAYEEVKSLESGKETVAAHGNVYETPNTDKNPQFQPDLYTSLYQVLDPGLSKDNKSVTYDNQVRYSKGVSEI
ncbi:uncharacterized protein LOC124271932 [Haliotis rubra]|uniref:uncharacterized protein LOC124271932 n=1 Tax=Haliotis rubra TaxID=36100 RepID=UPI001EE5B207|nr:uncharacterized protein LOC124271932 [Haliotis rubra]